MVIIRIIMVITNISIMAFIMAFTMVFTITFTIIAFTITFDYYKYSSKVKASKVESKVILS